jgi:hypothetical protein
MYLAPIRKTWLGQYPPFRRRAGLDGLGIVPVRIPSYHVPIRAMAAGVARSGGPLDRRALRFRRRGRLIGLGQESFDVTGSPTADYTYSSATGTYTGNPPSANLPTSPGQVNWTQVLTATVPSTDPLDYVSPQAAIAAGLDPNVVYSTWAAKIKQFPTAQAAVAAGVPAGVVTQLYTGPGGKPAISWLDQAPLGVSNKTLLIVGAAVFGLATLSGRRGRR